MSIQKDLDFEIAEIPWLPPRGYEAAREELSKLDKAPPSGQFGKSILELLEKDDYESVVRLYGSELKSLDAGEANNLGYALAWLALSTGHKSYWSQAIDALDISIKKSKDEKAKARSESNLTHVREAKRKRP